MDNRAWAKIGRIATVIAAVGTGILVWFQWSSPSADLALDASVHPYRSPPSYQSTLNTMAKTASWSNVLRILRNTTVDLSEEEASELARALSFALRDSLPQRSPGHGGLVLGSVKNSGNELAQSLRVSVPHAQVVRINRPGRKPRWEKVNGPVKLGDLQPQEEIDLVIWTSREMEDWDIDKFSLRHNDGTGDISVGQTVSGFPLTVATITEDLPFALGVSAWFIIFVGGIVLTVLMIVKKATTSSAQKSEAESD